MIQEKDEHGKKKFVTLPEMLERMNKKTKVPYKISRPIHLGEALIQEKFSVSDVNTWREMPKTFNVNGDRKRLWENEFSSAREVFEVSHDSEPLVIEE